jgi:3',5'-cyclic-AMP phosphodiesterase
MSTPDTYFIHITDTHITAPSSKPFLKLDTTAKLRAIFAAVRDLSIAPSFFVISGDLTHEGGVEDYRFLKSVIDEESASFGVPVFVTLGNHDHRAPFREGYLGEAPSEEPYYFTAMVGDVRVIVLNSQIAGKVDGTIDDAQLAWLREQVATRAPGGSILVLHHPPTPNTMPLLKDHGLTNPDALAEVIAGSDIAGVLSGHIHFNSIGVYAGALSVALAGSAFNLDPTTPTSMKMLDSSGYSLCMLRDGKLIAQPMPMPGEHPVVFHWQVGQSLQELVDHPERLPEEIQS